MGAMVLEFLRDFKVQEMTGFGEILLLHLLRILSSDFMNDFLGQKVQDVASPVIETYPMRFAEAALNMCNAYLYKATHCKNTSLDNDRPYRVYL